VRAAEQQQYVMRAPCHCGCKYGRIEKKGPNNVVFCLKCKKYAGYNAPKSETGEPQRHVSSRENIKPKKRILILIRDGMCRLCHRSEPEVILHVGHLLSFEDGRKQGISEELLNSEHNLAAMCEECNLGLGKSSIPLWLAVGILKAHDNDDLGGKVLREQNGLLSYTSKT